MNTAAPLPPDLAAAVQELLNLPPQQRFEIGEQLIASVPPLIDEASLADYRRRDQDLEDGTTKGIPAHEAVEAARQELRQANGFMIKAESGGRRKRCH